MWCQMFADILERPVELTKVSELGALGAAMCAGIGAGLYKEKRILLGRRKFVSGFSQGVGLVEGDILLFLFHDSIC